MKLPGITGGKDIEIKNKKIKRNNIMSTNHINGLSKNTINQQSRVTFD